MTVKLTIMYAGLSFYGYEVQNDLRTVQGELEVALERLYGKKIRSTPSGRTDAGVNALGQVVSFNVEKQLAPERIKAALNSFLPLDIRVKNVCYMKDDFNARRNAKSKTYEYYFYTAFQENPILSGRAMYIDSNLNIELMKEGAKIFLGEHDFKNFYCIGSSAKTTVRTIHECSLMPAFDMFGERVFSLRVSANGFLYKMVRLIAGALIRLGEGKLTLDEVRALIDCTAKSVAKIPAPAHGLCLIDVDYN